MAKKYRKRRSSSKSASEDMKGLVFIFKTIWFLLKVFLILITIPFWICYFFYYVFVLRGKRKRKVEDYRNNPATPFLSQVKSDIVYYEDCLSEGVSESEIINRLNDHKSPHFFSVAISGKSIVSFGKDGFSYKDKDFSYKDTGASYHTSSIVLSDSPEDGEILSKEHQFLNKDGSPNRRLKHNPVVFKVTLNGVRIFIAGKVLFTLWFSSKQAALSLLKLFNDSEAKINGGNKTETISLLGKNLKISANSHEILVNAVVSFSVLIAKADGVVSKEELVCITKTLLRQLRMTPEESQELVRGVYLKINTLEMADLLKVLSKTAEEYSVLISDGIKDDNVRNSLAVFFTTLLFEICNSDGVISKEEEAFIAVLANKFSYFDNNLWQDLIRLEAVNNRKGSGSKNSNELIEAARELFGVTAQSTESDIKKAYRDLSHKYHPDKYATHDEEFKKLAHNKFIEIQKAYELLTK